MLGQVEEGTGRVGTDRRTVRRDATKAEILEAAWELVREHGLGALALRDLAERVGMRAPSLYQYFPSKHAIYDAMFRQGTGDALVAVTAPVATSEPRAVLREIARRSFDFATSDPPRAQLLFQRTIPGFEPSPEAYAPAIEMHAHVAALLVSLGIPDPQAMDLFTALISGLVNQQLANDPGGSRWGRLVDRTVDMFLGYVARAAPTPKKRGRT